MGTRADDASTAHRIARDATDLEDRALISARAQRERLHFAAVGLRSIPSLGRHSIVDVAQSTHISHTGLVSGSLQSPLA